MMTTDLSPLDFPTLLAALMRPSSLVELAVLAAVLAASGLLVWLLRGMRDRDRTGPGDSSRTIMAVNSMMGAAGMSSSSEINTSSARLRRRSDPRVLSEKPSVWSSRPFLPR